MRIQSHLGNKDLKSANNYTLIALRDIYQDNFSPVKEVNVDKSFKILERTYTNLYKWAVQQLWLQIWTESEHEVASQLNCTTETGEVEIIVSGRGILFIQTICTGADVSRELEKRKQIFFRFPFYNLRNRKRFKKETEPIFSFFFLRWHDRVFRTNVLSQSLFSFFK